MKILKGYPEVIKFETSLFNRVDISASDNCIKVVYTTKSNKTEYKLIETKQEKLLLNK